MAFKFLKAHGGFSVDQDLGLFLLERGTFVLLLALDWTPIDITIGIGFSGFNGASSLSLLLMYTNVATNAANELHTEIQLKLSLHTLQDPNLMVRLSSVSPLILERA